MIIIPENKGLSLHTVDTLIEELDRILEFKRKVEEWIDSQDDTRNLYIPEIKTADYEIAEFTTPVPSQEEEKGPFVYPGVIPRRYSKR